MSSCAFAPTPYFGLNHGRQRALGQSLRRRAWRSQISMASRPAWEHVAGCDVLLPLGVATPRAVVHFAGGLGAGAAPKSLYGTFLERVVERGEVAVVATPVGSGFDHDRLAMEVATLSSKVLDALKTRWGVSWIPVVGLGHSLGAKLHLLANSSPRSQVLLGPRIANILIAFNNYSAAQSIPMWDSLRQAVARGSGSIPSELSSVLENVRKAGSSESTLQSLGLGREAAAWVAGATKVVGDLSEGIGSGGFTPSEAEVLERVRSEYSVNRNLVVSYTRDTIDCAEAIVPILHERYGEAGVVLRRLPGTHVTPNTPDIDPNDMQATGFGAVDSTVRASASSTMDELDNTVTVVVAFIALNLQLLTEQRRLPS